MSNPAYLFRSLLVTAIVLWAGYSPAALAQAHEIEGQWYQPVDGQWQYQGESQLDEEQLHAVASISLTGGTYWYQGRLTIAQAGRYVIDFKNTTTVGHFHHYLFDAQGQLLAESEGGIQSAQHNPFFLRHGREVELGAGEYRLITHISSPFYLAQPAPFIMDLSHYRDAIKGGNALVMTGFGLFLGLGFYYAALSMFRKRLAETMYTLFIIGNLLYNGTSLLILPELFGMHWFYMISVPILFSNMAYIGFVMALLHINRRSHPRLYTLGLVMLALLGLFAILALFSPHSSLEYARMGVAIFLAYGLTAGISRARQGDVTARVYLLAIGLFVIFGGSAISTNELPGIYTYQVEHLGLFAVAIEMSLLAFVLSYQFTQLQKEREKLQADINEERLYRKELSIAKAEAERANQAKSEFLSSMSHELRTPMNAILGYSEIMLEEDELPQQYADDVERIHKAGNHLLRLINDVLDLAKVESGSIDLSLEPVELNDVLEECCALLQPMAKKLSITLRCDDASGIELLADRIRLKQVLINLLSNAIKYNRSGGSVDIKVQHDNGRGIRIEVHDTGKGIAEDRLEELFIPFNRLDEENSETEGTGIGLTLTRTIVERMGGRIGVNSRLGEGSCFWIQLPAADSLLRAYHEDEDKSQRLLEQQQHIHGIHTVLYIDDNPANLSLVERILASCNYIKLLTANSPELGLEMAESQKPAIILVDINMPRIDGYQVLERIRNNPELADRPVFALTANAMTRHVDRGLDAGFNEYVTKPLEIGNFIRLINEYLLRSVPQPLAAQAMV